MRGRGGVEEKEERRRGRRRINPRRDRLGWGEGEKRIRYFSRYLGTFFFSLKGEGSPLCYILVGTNYFI